MTTWSMRIKSCMDESGMTQDMLAKKMGITRGAITHYLSGRRVPPLRQFQKLAAILKVDPAWLQFGTQTENKKVDKKLTLVQEKQVPTQKKIPILSWEQVSEFIDTKSNYSESKDYLQHFYTDKPHWYALRIKGDAMTAPLGNTKSFREGEIIIVDSDKEVKHGDYVIALLPSAHEATFKQYVLDGGVRYLKPLNPQYPITEIDESTHICGIVVRCISELSD